VQVTAVSDFEALSRLIAGDNPTLLLIDGDGWERPLDSLLRSLELKGKNIGALLLVGSLGADQLLQATALGIGTVILKPFKPEEHTARIYDLFLAARALSPRRAHPRYVPRTANVWKWKFSRRGLGRPQAARAGHLRRRARMELPDPPAAARLVPGSRWAVASLAAGGAGANVTFRVVHRSRQAIGVAFEQLIDRSGAFSRPCRVSTEAFSDPLCRGAPGSHPRPPAGRYPPIDPARDLTYTLC